MKVKEIQALLSNLDPEQDVTFLGSFSYDRGCNCTGFDQVCDCYNTWETEDKYFSNAEVITTKERKKTIVTIRLDE